MRIDRKDAKTRPLYKDFYSLVKAIIFGGQPFLAYSWPKLSIDMYTVGVEAKPNEMELQVTTF